MIPEAFIQELLNRVDIVDVVDKSVPLKKAGANYQACCPFHNEKSPSFTVSPTKQFYHCFGCGAHGTAIGFLMEHAGLSFVEAVHELAKQVGMIVPVEQRTEPVPDKRITMGLHEVLQQAAAYYKAELKKSQRAIDYLKGRGLSGQIAARFQIGYAPAGWQNLQSLFPQYDSEALQTAGLVVTNEQGKRYDRFRDRIMFPIHNQKGEVIGFGGRVINPEDTPKYYNSPETPLFQKGNELYGLFAARRAIRDAGRALVVEGYMDVVALAQYGIDYAVAALGTATTPIHVTKLMRQTDEIVFSFDGDNAGRTAAWRAAMNALPALKDGVKLLFLFLPKEHDPDSYVREFGREQFELEMQKAIPLSQYIVQHLSEQNPLASQEDKVRFLNDAEPILKQIQAPRYAVMLRKRIAELAGVSESEMQAMLRLPNPNKPAVAAMRRQPRAPLSLTKQFALMALMSPKSVEESDLALAEGSADESVLLREILLTCLRYPEHKPAALLHALQAHMEGNPLMNEMARELQNFDDTLDVAETLASARLKLQAMSRHSMGTKLLQSVQEKPLSAWSAEEREKLKNIRSK